MLYPTDNFVSVAAGPANPIGPRRLVQTPGAAYASILHGNPEFMKLIALLLGLGLERLATRVLHLRKLHWFDPYFDVGLNRLRGAAGWLVYPGSVVLILLPLIPVAWASRVLLQTGIPWDLPYLLFAVLVLFFCLGPRDLASEVDEYCRALANADADEAERVLAELCEVEHSGAKDVVAVEEAIFVQATNRFFGVVFWFVVLGPVGAWLFRVSDLLRRRAATRAVNDPEPDTLALPAIEVVHGILDWVPARLAVIGYALSGNFDEALNCWRQFELKSDLPFHHSNDQVVACVGKAAMGGTAEDISDPGVAARRAMQLVYRTLFIGVTVIAVMTLFGWAV